MPNVVDFLERMGQDAHLRYATSSEIERALTEAEIPAAVRVALLGEDQNQLETLLGASANISCAMHPPREGDDEDYEYDDEDEEDEDLDDEDDEDTQ